MADHVVPHFHNDAGVAIIEGLVGNPFALARESTR